MVIPSPPASDRRRFLRATLRGCLIGAGLALVGEAGRVLVGGNSHVVLPGKIYRSAQPSPAHLERLIHDLGIRTLVNLRGCCAGHDWYREECRVSARFEISQEDLCFSAGRMPSVPEVKRLVQVLDHGEPPFLFHCQRGADRTGLASVVALLLTEGVPYDTARRQLGLRFGHVALGRPANLDFFFRLYEEWLQQRQVVHTPERFRTWVQESYRPGACWAELELLEKPGIICVGDPWRCRIRCHNRSVRTWHFKAGSNAGIHLNFIVSDLQGGTIALGKAGLLTAEVPPSESIDLAIALPGMPRPERYRLMVDLVEEQHCNAYQVGSEPLEWEFEAKP